MFYCHFPDKLLADGEYVDPKDKKGQAQKKKVPFLKRLYRRPFDWWEERATSTSTLPQSPTSNGFHSITPYVA